MSDFQTSVFIVVAEVSAMLLFAYWMRAALRRTFYELQDMAYDKGWSDGFNAGTETRDEWGVQELQRQSPNTDDAS